MAFKTSATPSFLIGLIVAIVILSGNTLVDAADEPPPQATTTTTRWSSSSLANSTNIAIVTNGIRPVQIQPLHRSPCLHRIHIPRSTSVIASLAGTRGIRDILVRLVGAEDPSSPYTQAAARLIHEDALALGTVAENFGQRSQHNGRVM